MIRLEKLRPKGVPSGLGIHSENMAHRIAIRYPTRDEGTKGGVFIWRRETDNGLVKALGGRLFPGVHGQARFDVKDNADRLRYDVRGARGDVDLSLDLTVASEWRATRLFPQFDDVKEFFARGDYGYSCSLHGDRLEGLRLRSLVWEMTPLTVHELRSAFFEDSDRFPPGSVEVDGAVLMRAIPHEWHEIRDVPELATALVNP